MFLGRGERLFAQIVSLITEDPDVWGRKSFNWFKIRVRTSENVTETWKKEKVVDRKCFNVRLMENTAPYIFQVFWGSGTVVIVVVLVLSRMCCFPWSLRLMHLFSIHVFRHTSAPPFKLTGHFLSVSHYNSYYSSIILTQPKPLPFMTLITSPNHTCVGVKRPPPSHWTFRTEFMTVTGAEISPLSGFNSSEQLSGASRAEFTESKREIKCFAPPCLSVVRLNHGMLSCLYKSAFCPSAGSKLLKIKKLYVCGLILALTLISHLHLHQQFKDLNDMTVLWWAVFWCESESSLKSFDSSFKWLYSELVLDNHKREIHIKS